MRSCGLHQKCLLLVSGILAVLLSCPVESVVPRAIRTSPGVDDMASSWMLADKS